MQPVKLSWEIVRVAGPRFLNTTEIHSNASDRRIHFADEDRLDAHRIG